MHPPTRGGTVGWRGAVAAARPWQVPAGTRALLHLIAFEEPFGLSVAEALACGTPVIAHRRGSMPELIDDGVTGFIVETTEQAVDAVAAALAALPYAVAGDPQVDGVVDAYEGGYAAFVLAKAERSRQASASEMRRQNLARKELAWLRRGPPGPAASPWRPERRSPRADGTRLRTCAALRQVGRVWRWRPRCCWWHRRSAS